jgi:hypothetical protein
MGIDVDVGVGANVGASIDRDSIWFGVQREKINMERAANARMTIRVFLRFEITSTPYFLDYC